MSRLQKSWDHSFEQVDRLKEFGLNSAFYAAILLENLKIRLKNLPYPAFIASPLIGRIPITQGIEIKWQRPNRKDIMVLIFEKKQESYIYIPLFKTENFKDAVEAADYLFAEFSKCIPIEPEEGSYFCAVQ